MTIDYSFLINSPQYQALLFTGVRFTILIFALTWLFGMLLGMMLTVLRASGAPFVRPLVAGYVEYHRNVPPLIQLFVWYFGISSLLPSRLNDFVNENGAEVIFAVIAFSLNKAAFISEDLRAGLRSVPSTQIEAARSMGLTYFGAMRWVVLPQTWRAALPALANQTLFTFKLSALAAAIGATELTYEMRKIENLTYRIFEVYSVATVFYLFGSFLIMGMGAYVSAKFRLRRK